MLYSQSGGSNEVANKEAESDWMRMLCAYKLLMFATKRRSSCSYVR
jgi:hypothetical protein